MELRNQNLSSALSSYCYSLGLENTYMIVPIQTLSREHITNYWIELSKTEALKQRWCNIDNPTPDMAVDISLRNDPLYQMFGILYCDDGYMVAEFSLENFTGRAAQVHFSMRQDVPYTTKIALADQVTDVVLNDWTCSEYPDRPYLDTIYGLTPTIHRLACMFVLRAGFDKIGILPKGMYYMKQVSDAMLTIKTRRH